MNALIDRAHDEALAILVTHRATLDGLAGALIEKETVEDAELAELFKDIDAWPGMDDAGAAPPPEDPPAPIPVAVPVAEPVSAANATPPRESAWERLGRSLRRAPRPGTTA